MSKKLTLIIAFLFILFQAYSQERTISGKLVDETGAPLIGATVSLKGTTKAAVSDINGRYTITVPSDGGVLVFSFIGYQTQEIKVGTSDVIDIAMTPEVKSLNEVIVIGYGVQKKSLVTAAITKVDAKDMKNSVATNFEQAIQGKAAGVMITQNSGVPGAELAIKIRGNSSDGNNSPIYIVDGVKTSSMSYLNPSDIQSVEILKDASSAAIYGAEGGNGVVLITTKKGEKGSSQIEYSYSHGMQIATNLPSSMTGTQYRKYFIEAATWEKNNAKIAEFSALDSVTNTNWVKQVFQTAPINEHKISFSGGTDKTTYFVSGAYLTQDGIVGGPKNNFTRYALRANLQNEVKSWFDMGSDISYTRVKQNNLNAENEYGGIINNAIVYQPDLPVFYKDTSEIPDKSLIPYWNNKNGKYYTKSDITTGEAWNPLAQIDYSNDVQTQDKIVADLHVDFKPVKWAKLTSRIFVDYAYQLHDIFSGYEVYGTSPIIADTLTNINESWDRWYRYGAENFATFTKQFGEHNVDLMIGQSYDYYAHYWLNFVGYGVPYGDASYAYPAATIPQMKNNKISDESTAPEGEKEASYFGRFIYNYKEKYLLQGSMRIDGSSKFGSEHPWGYFPSVSAGWTISKEEFFNTINQSLLVNNLKLRASWGNNGSKQNLPSFPSLAVMNPVYYTDNSGNAQLQGLYPGITTAGLKWETSRQTDIGVDLGILKNSLTMSIDWYNKTSIDQLAQNSTQPYDLGFNNFGWINSGKVENKGWEFDINYRNSIGAFKYNILVNASHNKNEVLSYVSAGKNGANVGQLGYINRYEVGQPVWYFVGRKAIGIFQTQDEINNYVNIKGQKLQPVAKPGDVKWADINGDGVINDNDATYLGKPEPDWYYGFTLNGEYKGLEISLFFQGVAGNQIYWAGYRQDRTEYNKPSIWYDKRWTGPGTSNTYPRATNSDVNKNFAVSSLNVFNGDYLRFKNLTLAYTFPDKWSKKIAISRLRIFYTGTNLWTTTKYPGTDPEVGYYDVNNNYSYGIDKGLYPPTRVNTIGVTVTF